MNETPSAPTNDPKTSGMAIWSLVLGILSLICFSIFTAVPAVICGHVAYSRIKRSAGAITGHGLAIAGLVTGYLGIAWAVIFIPMMLAIAIPNFVRARNMAQINGCNNNLQQINGAKSQWALENKKEDTATPTRDELNRYFKDQQFPVCPAGGTYTLNAVKVDPVCSVPGHQLPKP